MNKYSHKYMHIARLFAKCQQFRSEVCRVTEFYSWAYILKRTIAAVIVNILHNDLSYANVSMAQHFLATGKLVFPGFVTAPGIKT